MTRIFCFSDFFPPIFFPPCLFPSISPFFFSPSLHPCIVPVSFHLPFLPVVLTHRLPRLHSAAAPLCCKDLASRTHIQLSAFSPHPGGFVHPPLRLSDTLVGPTTPQTAGPHSPRHPILGPRLPSGDTGVYPGGTSWLPWVSPLAKTPQVPAPQLHLHAQSPWVMSRRPVHGGRALLTLHTLQTSPSRLVTQSYLTLATPWTAARPAPPCMGFSRPEHWSVAMPSSRASSDPGIEPTAFPASSALQA